MHHQHDSAVCVKPGGRCPTPRGCETHAVDRELTRTFERRGQTNFETLTLVFCVVTQSVSCDDDSVLAQVVRNTSLHFHHVSNSRSVAVSPSVSLCRHP